MRSLLTYLASRRKRGIKFVAPDGTPSVLLTGRKNLLTGTFKTALAGRRIEISQSGDR